MKKIFFLLVCVLIVFFFLKKNNTMEVSLIKKFNDEYYSFDSLVPGDKKTINYTITNNGNSAIKVRVKISEKWTNSIGKIVNAPSDAVVVNINYNDWYYKDEYYYYRHVLAVGDTTEPLVYYIELNDNLSDVDCKKSSDGLTEICTGDMDGLAGLNYKISFKNNCIDVNVAEKIWK